MLYMYDEKNNSIERLQSYNYEDLGGLEKDLENLLANNLSELYAEGGQLLPIFQERRIQPEPDLCALDKDGNLYIFELKRGIVPGDTTIQVMRYCQEYGQKDYYELCSMYKTYTKDTDSNLAEVHREAFDLEQPLKKEEFNRKQKLIVIGSNTDQNLMDAVTYWRQNGIDIDYIPYRFYKINGSTYFEFFAKPFDFHMNITDTKGILFDTNKSYDEDSIWDMLANSKVSAYGSVKTCVNSFKKGDYVLYYHKGYGVVGAGIIKSSKAKTIDKNEEMYMDVNLLTPVVTCEDDLEYVTVAELKQLLGKNFFWARTTKVPYLSEDESKKVVELLLKKYDNQLK